MSRLIRLPVEIPAKVKVEIEPSTQTILVEGPNGKLQQKILPETDVVLEGNTVRVQAKSGIKRTMFAGTMMALLRNMLIGVSIGFEKNLN